MKRILWILLIASASHIYAGDAVIESRPPVCLINGVDGKTYSGVFAGRREEGMILTHSAAVGAQSPLGATVSITVPGTDYKNVHAVLIHRPLAINLAILQVKGLTAKFCEDAGNQDMLAFGAPIKVWGISKQGEVKAVDATIALVRLNSLAQPMLVDLNVELEPSFVGGAATQPNGIFIGVVAPPMKGAKSSVILCNKQVLAPEVQEFSIHELSNANGVVKFQCDAKLFNPGGRMQSISVAAAAVADSFTAKPRANGGWTLGEPFPGWQSVKCNGNSASGVVECKGAPGGKQNFGYYYLTGNDFNPNDFQCSRPAVIEVKMNAASPEPSLPAALPVTTPPAKVTVPSFTINGALVLDFKLEKLEMCPDLVWAADGKSFFVLEKNGNLRCIDTDSLQTLRQAPVGAQFVRMGRCRSGLALLASNPPQLIVVDEAKFEVKARMKLESACSLAASPASDIVFVSGEPRFHYIFVACDVQKQVVEEVKLEAKPAKVPQNYINQTLGEFEQIAITPDGACLIASANNRLHRFAVNGSKLTYEEAGVKQFDRAISLNFSSDSAYVAAGRSDEGVQINDTPAKAVYVFKVRDLQTPMLSLAPLNNCETIAFEKRTHRIFATANDQDSALVVFDSAGEKQKQYALSDNDGYMRVEGDKFVRQGPFFDDATRCILPHPARDVLIVLTNKHLFHVELPSAR